MLIPYLYGKLNKTAPTAPTDLSFEINQLKAMEDSADVNDSSQANQNHFTARKKYDYAVSLPVELFYFDPNTLNEAGWKKLGVKDKTIATIHNYINKGGKFRQPADLKKIWGLHEKLVSALLPYVRIKEQEFI